MKPLAIYGLLGGIVVLGFTIHALKTGKARFKLRIDDRKKEPTQFWSSIAVYLILAGAFFFVAIREQFFSN